MLELDVVRTSEEMNTKLPKDIAEREEVNEKKEGPPAGALRNTPETGQGWESFKLHLLLCC